MKRTLLSRDGKTALYQSVVEDVRARIEQGEVRPGERLPSIAALCERYGVSNITISAALRDLVAQGYVESRPRSGVFVRERLHDTAASLSGERVIACVMPGRTSPFWMEIIHGAEDACQARGFRLLVTASDDDAGCEAQQLRTLAGEVAGLLVTPVAANPDYAAYAGLLQTRVPWVFVDHYLEKLAVPSVTTDNVQGGLLATRHLLEVGRQQIFVIAEGDTSSTRERIEGCQRALKESGIAWDERLIYRGPVGGSTGYEGMKMLLERFTPVQPFGVFAMNEYIARGAYLALKEANLRIPDDAAVIGFDDAFAPFFEPPLSTIRQNLREMGATAARLLLDEITAAGSGKTALGKRGARSVRLKPELIVRNSSDGASEFSLQHHFSSKPNGKPTPARRKDKREAARSIPNVEVMLR